MLLIFTFPFGTFASVRVFTNRNYNNFMFRLTTKEVEAMVSQNAIPSKQHLGGYLPYAFTEHGVLMLASILKSKQALEVIIRVIEIFVKMREMLSTNKDILLKMQKVEKKLIAHDAYIQLIFEALKRLNSVAPHTTILTGFVRCCQALYLLLQPSYRRSSPGILLREKLFLLLAGPRYYSRDSRRLRL
ncbi:MAG: ORF6N domain-containing protein [Chitinophagaceae bacterium]|nr:ORF6N domain-containing protein [Chitinophagaceae bacterium]